MRGPTKNNTIKKNCGKSMRENGEIYMTEMAERADKEINKDENLPFCLRRYN